jgi:hypothetical protein
VERAEARADAVRPRGRTRLWSVALLGSVLETRRGPLLGTVSSWWGSQPPAVRFWEGKRPWRAGDFARRETSESPSTLWAPSACWGRSRCGKRSSVGKEAPSGGRWSTLQARAIAPPHGGISRRRATGRDCGHCARTEETRTGSVGG